MLGLFTELSIAENTLTIYSADNGGSLHWGILGGTNGDLRCGKGTLWEGGVRVPALVYGISLFRNILGIAWCGRKQALSCFGCSP